MTSMLINLVLQNAERQLLLAVEQGDQLRSALHFRGSQLERRLGEEEILLMVRPLLADKHAAIYYFYDGDVVITWAGVQKALLEDLCKRLYALLPLTPNEMLHTYYDFNAHGEDLRLLCKRKIEALSLSGNLMYVDKPKSLTLDLTPEQIALFKTMEKTRGIRKKLEILVVEDQIFSNRLLAGLLRKIGETHMAFDALDGLELYLAHAPDIVFLDVEMPGINGHDLAAAIHQLDKDAYIVMVTANNYIEDVTRAKKNGAKGFVIKPYSKLKILENVEKFIHERKLKP